MRTRRPVTRAALAAALLLSALLLSAILAPVSAGAEPRTLVLEGEVPASAPEVRHFYLDFQVPENTAEIEIAHDDLSEANILDWGLDGPSGFRGWGGGNTEPAIVGPDRASRSYLPGPLTPGTWRVVVGKAKILEPPGRYRVAITLRDAPTLPAQPERRPYAPTPPLAAGPRWYAGDLHVHSRESGDAEPTLDAVATFAESRGLDFVMLSEHNTTSQLELYERVQAEHPALLLLPGAEVTTYGGHFNALGATRFVEHRLGLPDTSIEATAAAVHDQGALVSINHPALALGDACIGCAWTQDLDAAAVDAVEIGTGDILKPGGAFNDRAIAFWESLCDTGARPAAVGGSDDHSGGTAMGALDSPIGSPTTVIFAESLSVDALLAGVQAGNTVVKLHGPEDPMVEFWPPAPEAPGALSAQITGGVGYQARWVRDGVAGERVDIDTDPFTLSGALAPTETSGVGAESRVRVEVLQGNRRRTVTSHRWLVVPEAPAPPPDAAPPRPDATEAFDASPPPADAAPPDAHPEASRAPDANLADAGAAGAGSSGGGGCAFTGIPHPARGPAAGLALAMLAGLGARGRRRRLDRRDGSCHCHVVPQGCRRTRFGSTGDSI